MATYTPQRLVQSLTLTRGTAIAISMVVGSGILVLPGVVYRQVGGNALSLWISTSLLVVPLLAIFTWLGKRFPGAGGVTAYVREAFPASVGACAELLLLGAFSIQIAATAITGGSYFSVLVGGNALTVTLAAFACIGIAGLVNLRGGQISGQVQQMLVLVLMVLLVASALVALVFGDMRGGEGVTLPTGHQWLTMIPTLPLIFFAFTGWETFCATTEEYSRDYQFPLAVALSFGIVVTIYLLIVTAIAMTLPPSSAGLSAAPIAALITVVAGPLAGKLVAILALIIIVTNVIGITFAISRIVFASSRAGLLPRTLSYIDTKTKAPTRAVLVTMGIFTFVVILHTLGIISLETLFTTTGQLFVLIYGISIAAFLKLWCRTRQEAKGQVQLHSDKS